MFRRKRGCGLGDNCEVGLFAHESIESTTYLTPVERIDDCQTLLFPLFHNTTTPTSYGHSPHTPRWRELGYLSWYILMGVKGWIE